MSPRTFPFFVLILLGALAETNFASVISVEENGYKGIVVAIHKNVPEDLEILNNIKVRFLIVFSYLKSLRYFFPNYIVLLNYEHNCSDEMVIKNIKISLTDIFLKIM